jgi:hypothetical protein
MVMMKGMTSAAILILIIDNCSDDEYETKKIFNVANTGWC